MAVHADDDWRVQRDQRRKPTAQIAETPMHRPRIAGRAQMVQVAAGAEGGAVARQEDRADAGLALGHSGFRGSPGGL
ncbi:hypothetical protein G6F22_021747 [Rhizopus arrhizus]|nr:hypothetical protein G6F22_021747 [Rhizopus arrhizus]